MQKLTVDISGIRHPQTTNHRNRINFPQNKNQQLVNTATSAFSLIFDSLDSRHLFIQSQANLELNALWHDFGIVLLTASFSTFLHQMVV